MFNTTNYQQINSLLSQSEEALKILTQELNLYPGVIEQLTELKDKLSKTQVNSLTTDNLCSPSGKELHLREISYVLVNAYTYVEAANIQDVFYQIDGTELAVGMITIRPGVLIGKAGQCFNKAVEELKEKFINDVWGFTDVKLELIENKFRMFDYHFEGIGDY